MEFVSFGIFVMRNGLIIDDEGTQRWLLDDQYHRENGLPAIIQANGHQAWYHHGKCHRKNGLPAIIFADGRREWYLNGQYHRENGPAIIGSDGYHGYQAWYLHGKPINVKKWIGQNRVVASWETWDDVTWSLFRLEFL